jgi:hypothetical protein
MRKKYSRSRIVGIKQGIGNSWSWILSYRCRIMQRFPDSIREIFWDRIGRINYPIKMFFIRLVIFSRQSNTAFISPNSCNDDILLVYLSLIYEIIETILIELIKNIMGNISMKETIWRQWIKILRSSTVILYLVCITKCPDLFFLPKSLFVMEYKCICIWLFARCIHHCFCTDR